MTRRLTLSMQRLSIGVRRRAAKRLVMTLLALAVGRALGAQSAAPASRSAADSGRLTTLVILGVEHSAQLAARAYHPGFFRAFFDRVRPAAICIERSPDEFARG